MNSSHTATAATAAANGDDYDDYEEEEDDDDDHREAASAKPVMSSVYVNSSSNGTKSVVLPAQTSQATQSHTKAPLSPCPYRVIEICNICWTRSNSKEVVTKSPKGNHCSKVGHPWIGVSFLILPCKKLLANLPPTIPRNLKFAICWDLTRKKRCTRGDCTFAHCEEEMSVWTWMIQNKGNTFTQKAFCSH